MSATIDLWPQDFGEQAVRTPLYLLKQQAGLLGRRTKNLVEAEVIPIPDKNGFRYQFNIVAPALNQYRYGLFSINHGIDLYPVFVEGEGLGRGTEIKSEEQLIEHLRDLFNSERTRKIVSALLAQSTAA